jgi:putative transposase
MWILLLLILLALMRRPSLRQAWPEPKEPAPGIDTSPIESGLGIARRGNRKHQPKRNPRPSQTPKPVWVIDEVLKLRVLMPTSGCRKIADTFNHRHRRHGITIGKSFVADKLKKHSHQLEDIRRKVRNRRPAAAPKNRTWALDLTFVDQTPLLGIIDHGTRACLTLVELKDRSTAGIVAEIHTTVARFGKPVQLRSDNEPIFTSAAFSEGLAKLGIEHQRIAPFAPWQNGRIERFFGTFKRAWRRRPVADQRHQPNLDVFRTWYNHVRTHQNLGGLTPALAWQGIREPRGQPFWFSEWEGALVGDLYLG